MSEYLIAELAQQVDLDTVDGRARLAEIAKPLVARIPQGVYRELLIESLAETVGLTSGKLEKMLGIENLYAPEMLPVNHAASQALVAHTLKKIDVASTTVKLGNYEVQYFGVSDWNVF